MGRICLERASLKKGHKREKRRHVFGGVLKGAEVGCLPISISYEEQLWPAVMPLRRLAAR